MTEATKPRTTGGPVIYAGGFKEIEDLDLPGIKILNRWQVLPRQLAPVLRNASALAVLDPLSFPSEALTDEQWDVPMLTTLPPSLDFEALTTVFGPALFERLGPFDRVAVPDTALWDRLRLRYSWACSQRVDVETGDPVRAAALLLDAIGTTDRSLRPAKAAHRAQLRALLPRFESPGGQHLTGALPSVLEVGEGTGRWASGLDLSNVRFYGVYEEEASVEAARADYPEQSFECLDESMAIPHENETFDMCFCVNYLRSRPAPAKRALVSEMWRVIRPEGRLFFLEDVVSGEDQESEEDSPISATEFIELVREVAPEPVALDHLESILYPGEDMCRGALMSFSRSG